MTTHGLLCPCEECGAFRDLQAVKRAPAPTEMTSLREIKDKLDAIQMALISPDGLFSYRQRIEQKLDALAESQGKLLAAIDNLCNLVNTFNEEICERLMGIAESQSVLSAKFSALDAGLHETAMRNHVQLLEGQKAIDQRLYAVEQFLYANKLLRKARKKARKRAAGRGE